MDGANIVAAVSVLVSGATAITAPFIAGRNQLRADESKTARELSLRDRDEIRALVDEIALAAPNVVQAQAAFRSTHNTSEPGDMTRVSPRMTEYIEAREELIRYDTRLLLRLGIEHPVRRALAALIDEVTTAGSAVTDLVTVDQAPPPNKLEISIAERARMIEAQRDFLRAAAAWMGDAHDIPVKQGASRGRRLPRRRRWHHLR